jgi:hypothetical protein
MTSHRAVGPQLEVRILGMPVAAYERASQYDDELLRELAFVVSGEPEPGCAPPAVLAALTEELGDGFPPYTEAPRADVQAAVVRGEGTVDITVGVSTDARGRAASFVQSMAAADDQCRCGGLLTLAAPPDVVELREWYLRQIVDQIDGRAPTPWADR